ncbi:putative transcription regulator protein [Pseudooceanicola batsensis HTCC2597]|uniref:Putative transcription regulator protein n=1 Tax=Pseudooceanicola batsensis (strain ATCC BAA-863 / DSM 15984 / KCTC 12145 / HTCC2597) TaxID=252305 RepID=A3TYL9_PSEBH|nr:GntR family transcriptional regulator [Pseudooceanicola batsensis]EAQ03253.1 putative transcription regulator protein [Pseudooceanicola batsensis HTCC2597]
MNRIERPKSLTELVFEGLKAEIVTGQLEMGEMLSETRIATRLEVSRTPVREAFARLELEGLVESRPQRGTFVLTMGNRELQDICDTRVCLETGALRTAFERARADLIAALRRILVEMSRARREDATAEYLRLDAEYHEAILTASRNPFMLDAYMTIAAKMSVLRNKLGDHPDHMRKSFDEHRRLIELLEAGDLPAATKMLVSHIGRKEGSYWNIPASK